MTSTRCIELELVRRHFDIVPAEDTDTWGQLILLTTVLNHKSCINTSRQVLENTLFAINAIFSLEKTLVAINAIFSKKALIANSVFFKIVSKSIYTSNLIKGCGQGGLKRKNY